MPDAQTLNSVLASYGASGLLGSGGGGFNWWNIITGFIFGIVGWYAFMHGWKSKSIRPSIIGVALMIYPYFVSNTVLSIIIGLALCAALYYWR
jgi:hypothetical protein